MVVSFGRALLRKVKSKFYALPPSVTSTLPVLGTLSSRNLFKSSDLDDFVKKTDSLGGPGSVGTRSYWESFEFQPDIKVDQSLDPFSEEYCGQQIRLYEEISGRRLNQTDHELLEIDVELHLNAPNPYNHPDPSVFAGQLAVLAIACQLSGAARGSRVLDMGCGWGLSSEVLAYCGYQVDAVDINQQFIDLVNRRAEKLGLSISAYRSNFSVFVPEADAEYTFALFYECLHHAIKPWEVLRSVATMLEPGGKIILASEPIQDTWWRTWGLRLDPLSVYCIRKYGWFESGWSLTFLTQMFEQSGFSLRSANANGIKDAIYIGTLRESSGTRNGLSLQQLKSVASKSDWWHEESYLISKGASSIRLDIPAGTLRIIFLFTNFRAKPIDASVSVDDCITTATLAPGKNRLSISWDGSNKSATFTLRSGIWSPSDELGNGDKRQISVHLSAVRFA